jgi:hypothetical protein
MQNQQNLQSTDSTKGCDQPDEIHQNGKIIIAKGVEPRNFMETTIKTRGRSEIHEIKKHLASDRAAEIAEEPLVRSKQHEETAKIVTPPRNHPHGCTENRARTSSGAGGGRRGGGRARRRRGREEEEQGGREGREVERGGEGPPGEEHYRWLSARAP